MLLRRRVHEFNLDLVWDGQRVMVDYGQRNLDHVGDARGVRTASEIMKREIDAMHEACQGMEGKGLL